MALIAVNIQTVRVDIAVNIQTVRVVIAVVDIIVREKLGWIENTLSLLGSEVWILVTELPQFGAALGTEPPVVLENVHHVIEDLITLRPRSQHFGRLDHHVIVHLVISVVHLVVVGFAVLFLNEWAHEVI